MRSLPSIFRSPFAPRAPETPTSGARPPLAIGMGIPEIGRRPPPYAPPSYAPPAARRPERDVLAVRAANVRAAEAMIRRFEGRSARIESPFAAFPTRSFWLSRLMVESRRTRSGTAAERADRQPPGSPRHLS